MWQLGPPWIAGHATSHGRAIPREHLAGELDSITLAVFMWLNLEEACTHLRHEPVSELFERFIRWTHYTC